MHSAHTWRGNAASDFLDTSQAADYLGLKRTTLEAWRCRGGGPRYIKLRHRVKYRKNDLDLFIEECLRYNTSESAG